MVRVGNPAGEPARPGLAWRDVRDALARPGGSPGDRARWRKLVALCATLNVTEAALVAGLAGGAHPDLAPQASAVAPFGVFGDLRWISVYHDSWLTLAAEVVAMLAVRGALTAGAIALAWPSHIARPGPAVMLRRGVFATALASLFLWPSVALLFGLAVVPVSWLFLAAVPTALLVAFLLHPAAVSGDWWRRLVAPRAVAWVAFAFLTLSVASAVMTALPSVFWPLVAALSGLFNAWSWVGLVHAVVDRRPVHRAVPVAALVAAVLVGVVIGGTVLGFGAARTSEAKEAAAHGPISAWLLDGPVVAGPAVAAAPAVGRSLVPGTTLVAQAPPLGPLVPRDDPAVLIVSGYGSAWSGREDHPLPGDFLEQRFSYRGLSPTGRPLPYTSADTAKPLVVLDRMLLAQVAALRSATNGRPVYVIAESEGALIAKTALLADPARAVSELVLASPLEDPGRVWYPAAGDDGWGMASSEAMKLISDAFQGVAPINLSPDNPLFASLDDQGLVLQKAMSCPISGVHQFALLPLADATVTAAPENLSFPSIVLPAFHGGLLETTAGQQVVSDVLRGRPVDRDELLQIADEVISYAASAWQVPSLAVSDYPRGGHGDAPATLTCGRVAEDLHAALSPS